MRLLFALILCTATVIPTAFGQADNFTPIRIALNDSKAPLGATLRMLRGNRPQIAFCGQCTKNSECGTCRCTGPVDGTCNECKCP